MGHNRFNIVDGLQELPSKPYEIKNSTFARILCDTHFQFHDRRAIEIAVNYRGKEKVDTIILLGDILDFYSLSRHNKNPNYAFLKQEFKLCRSFFEYLRGVYPNVRIIYLEGNHEDRLRKYLWQNAGALEGIDEILLEAKLEFSKFRIENFEHGTILQYGQLHLVHGNELGLKGGINPARSQLLKAFDNIAYGNFHKSQTSSWTSISNKEYVSTAIGCLCQLNPRYMPAGHGWNLGFADIERDGKFFDLQNHKILKHENYRVVRA